MSDNKTLPTPAKVADFLAQIPDERRRQDSEELCRLMTKATGVEPVMWGSSIVGFGKNHYVYESGREGDTMAVGFAPRKDSLVLYSVVYYDQGVEAVKRLGKYKLGKGCLYIKRLSDVDLDVLSAMVARAFKAKNNA